MLESRIRGRSFAPAMRFTAPFLVLALLAAGCVSPPTDDGTAALPAAEAAAGWERVRGLLADVPCEAELGEGTSANMLELARLAYPEESGAHGEIDVRGDLAVAARYQSGGLEVLDLSDPTNLTLLSTLEIEDSIALDVKWTPDGDGAIIGDRAKVHLVDLTDPANPVLRSTFHYEGNATRAQAHMVTPWKFEDGSEYVYVATQVGRQPLLVLERDGWNLSLAGQYAFSPVLASDAALGQHDMTVYHDELLDKPLLFVAEGTLGWSAADLSDPANPVRIGGTLSPEPGVGYTHTVRVEYVDGKRIVATISEVGANTLKVYDATNLEAPVLLARWNADATRPHMPQHNIQLKDGMLYLAHYTEGIYVFNITGVMQGPPLVGTLEMEPMARFAVENPQDGGALGFANVWDVVVSKGIVYVNDMSHGLTSVGFGCLQAGDVEATATA